MNEILDFLGTPTPKAWVDKACEDIETLLIDHKNCEYKAASNALNLMARYQSYEPVVMAMSKLAREELVHYEKVVKLIKARGYRLLPLSAARYAQGLRAVLRKQEPELMIDLFLISAFIEARSCERFHALIPHLDEGLAGFYQSLLESEKRHYLGYIKLAYLYGHKDDIDQRLSDIRPIEQALIASPDPQFRFHSGPPQ